MKTFRIVTAVCLFVATFSTLTYAQGTTNDKAGYNSWSVTLSGGSMLFYGDLRQYDFYPVSKSQGKVISERQMGFGLAVNKQFTPVVALQGFIQSGKLSGIKRYLNAYFETSFISYGINARLNIIPLFNPSSKGNNKFSPYAIVGFGLCSFKSLQSKISDGTEIHSFGYGKYRQKKENTNELNIPIGLGLKYKLNSKFDIGLELTMNNVNTDKLDARKRPNTSKDKYQYTSIGITYNIGKSDKSLEWITPKEQESDDLAPLFAAINKKIDSLGKKLNEVDGKVGVLQKEVADLKNFAKQTEAEKTKILNTPVAPVEVKAEIVPQFSIFFNVNSNVVDALNQEKIASAAKMLKENPDMKFELVGHADKTGGQLYNELLSKKRAQAVYDLLVKSYGIAPARISVIGKGTNDALSSNVLSVNRRVDFMIKK